jgi:DNA-binding XRE family transcriptional regulator
VLEWSAMEPGRAVYLRIVHSPGLLVMGGAALKLGQRELGELLGVSRRTMQRWQKGDGFPSIQQWALLARHVYAVNPDLAARIATQMGETLESLRIVAPAPPPIPVAPPPVAVAPPPVPLRPQASLADLVDSVVCAAAEAIAVAPQSIRPALLAAFARAASVSLTVDEVRGALASPAVETPATG